MEGTDSMKRSPLRVLLVEDSVDDVNLFTLAARKCAAALELETVQDGEEAVQYLKRTNTYAGVKLPDLILLDLNMPRMNGREVLREIKADNALKRIPVIVMTTSESPTDISESYAAGAACYITKPHKFEDLKNVISKLSDFWGLLEYPAEFQRL
jgi:two-component system, chemotaxis family, response regulator Rcp1